MGVGVVENRGLGVWWDVWSWGGKEVYGAQVGVGRGGDMPVVLRYVGRGCLEWGWGELQGLISN